MINKSKSVLGQTEVKQVKQSQRHVEEKVNFEPWVSPHASA